MRVALLGTQVDAIATGDLVGSALLDLLPLEDEIPTLYALTKEGATEAIYDVLDRVDDNLVNEVTKGTLLAIAEEDLDQTDGTESSAEISEDALTVGIRIVAARLTAQNLVTIISALTELSTKYWLIAKGRFADLIEYTQTHNGRFAEEAGLTITKVTYNSPFNMDLRVDLSAPSVAEALITTIDGIAQVPKRLKQKELENQAKAQEIQHVEQQANQEQHMAVLEREQKRLEIEKQRLEVLEKQLEVQKKGIEYALEIAGKVVDLLHPSADQATRAMEIQALLPNLVQLQNGEGLELVLPTSQENPSIPKQS